ncbi:hypothetical protein [Falsiroseomonas sp.]|uniref:hypothetical protein n=1 Tax=Falsiroseomonas sp. TaxID=2870721 RepID=UPI003565EF99
MWRTVLIGASLTLAACGTAPGPDLSGPAPAGAPRTVQNLPEGVAGPASDAPFFPFGGARLPRLRGWSQDDERPPWLRDLPEQLERHPVPDRWPNDTLAKLRR